MTLETPTLDQVLDLAHRLPREQRGQLIAGLALELAASEPPPARRQLSPDEARALWAQLRESMRELPTPRPTLGEQLEADRRDRDRALLGRHAESDDVDA